MICAGKLIGGGGDFSVRVVFKVVDVGKVKRKIWFAFRDGTLAPLDCIPGNIETHISAGGGIQIFHQRNRHPAHPTANIQNCLVGFKLPTFTKC